MSSVRSLHQGLGLRFPCNNLTFGQSFGLLKTPPIHHMVRNGHVPLTSLSFSIASSTTYSDERCSSVFLYSWACEFHLQLFGRQSGIAFRSSPVLVHAVSISANEKVVTPLVFFTSKIQSRLH